MQKADVEGKIALVTGSSGGVGLRVAEALARGRATVVVNSRSQENGKRTVDHLTGISDKVHLAVGDCENYDAAAEVARQASGVTGGIDILVSAGAASRILPRPFAEMTGTELVDAFSRGCSRASFPCTRHCRTCASAAARS